MKRKGKIVSLFVLAFMVGAIFCFFVSIFPSSVLAADYYVRTSGDDANDGTTGDDAHAWKHITHALSGQGTASVVTSGDSIHVAAGTYSVGTNGETSGANALIELVDGVSLVGTGADTVINAEGARRAVYGTNISSSTVISNLKITGGSGVQMQGGGIFLSNCTAALSIENCQISNNSVSSWLARGGGIYCDYSHPRIRGCTISGNTSLGRSFCGGGGIFCNQSSPEITDCTISGNTGGSTVDSDYGGGGGRNILLLLKPNNKQMHYKWKYGY